MPAVRRVRVLATSREALGLRGEHVISLSSLPADDAVGLFCTRAAEARADLAFDDATLAAVGEICGQLDGIPLAIELAATRCRSMAPAEIAVRLDDRFRLLRGGRGGVERHQTLHAAVEWSYSLLDPEERALFECLAVFADGGLLDAITAVSGLDEYDALDLLDRLVARSMVVAIDTQLGTRYRQLETLRQYAEGRLVEHGRIDEARDRHLSWVQTLTGWLRTTDGTRAEMAGYWRYAAELDNIRAAVHYAIAAHRLEEACEIIAGLTLPAFWRASYEIIDWFDPTTIPAHEWTDGVASVAGFQAVFAIFAGDHARMFALIDRVPDAYARNFEVLHARTYASLWVRPDTSAAQATLDAIAPHDYYESFVEAVLRTHLFVRQLYTDGADDPDVAAAALEHVDTWIAAVRAADQRLTLACALLTAAGLVDLLGDWNRAVAMNQEALDLAEGTGAELLTDFALERHDHLAHQAHRHRTRPARRNRRVAAIDSPERPPTPQHARPGGSCSAAPVGWFELERGSADRISPVPIREPHVPRVCRSPRMRRSSTVSTPRPSAGSNTKPPNSTPTQPGQSRSPPSTASSPNPPDRPNNPPHHAQARVTYTKFLTVPAHGDGRRRVSPNRRAVPCPPRRRTPPPARGRAPRAWPARAPRESLLLSR